MAAHNVFTHPRYWEMVERSPVLDARRRDLLARALQVVATERLAERDPLVVVWLESLGEEAGGALQALDVSPADTDEHVLAIADGFVPAGEGRSTENLLWAYNLLTGRTTGYRDVVDASAILSLRRLELIERWLGTFDSFSADPLTRAVVQSLEDEVAYFEPGGMWTLRDDALLNLHERHRGQPEAHEILWQLVTSPALEDCEGYFACHARASVLNRVGRYWVAYPDGPLVAEALTRARDRMRGFLQRCRAARDAAPGSRESRWREAVGWEYGDAETVLELRASLSEVADEVKAPLVDLLDALEECADVRVSAALPARAAPPPSRAGVYSSSSSSVPIKSRAATIAMPAATPVFDAVRVSDLRSSFPAIPGLMFQCFLHFFHGKGLPFEV